MAIISGFLGVSFSLELPLRIVIMHFRNRKKFLKASKTFPLNIKRKNISKLISTVKKNIALLKAFHKISI